MAREYLAPADAGSVSGATKTIPKGFTNLKVKAAAGNAGNVIVHFFKDGADTGYFDTLEAGDKETYFSGGVMWDAFTIEVPVGDTAYYVQIN